MGTLLLSAAGSAIGSVFGPLGAIVGQAVGGLIGNAVDQSLFGNHNHTTRQVGKLADLAVQSSSEGTAIPRVFGRVRLAGEIIWATRLTEVVNSSTSPSGGGKSLGGGSTVTTESYSYFANFAVGLCEGEIARVGRIWANGKLLDQTRFTLRVYKGSETQAPDSLIEARQGSGNTPAYRGLAYVVFENFPLESFGNAIPQLSFEVFRVVGKLERQVRAVTLIPGATEFGYAPAAVTRTVQEGQTASENRHVSNAASDVIAALDDLQAACPDLRSVALVVSWFGTDLRVGNCLVTPKVDRSAKQTSTPWSVAGLDRAGAPVVSLANGSPAFGGTPSDASVMALIRVLKARGLAVTLYPLMMMDIPEGNGLPDPYGGSGQGAYPWRGRITCHPAPGRSGSPDRTASAEGQLSGFVGTAQAAHFAIGTDSVAYSGPAEWTYRRMVLHMAALGAAAGGVEGFLIGSEMIGLTTLRSSASSYPFVSALQTLASDAKSLLGGGTKVGYAADWSEYSGHRPADGSGDVYFHLDPLWADSHIDFVGIDAYFPLADWRDGQHLDRALADRPTDPEYIKANIFGGEYHDWFYASLADRLSQTRTPITDGAAAKPWVFRAKDFRSWWANRHYNRPGGVESATPTGWLPGLKPIRFTELGIPAVDKGTNQPNVYPDPKSSENGTPWFSAKVRDDAIQRAGLSAVLGYFDPAEPGFDSAANPLSPLDGRRMLDLARCHLWTFDARPFPQFPAATDLWSDGVNWQLGHWLTGRLGAAPVGDIIVALCAAFEVGPVEASRLTDVVDGFVISDRASLRSILEPLSGAFGFHVQETASGLLFAPESLHPVASFTPGTVVEDGNRPLIERRRAEEADLPTEVAITFMDGEADYQQATVYARRSPVTGRRAMDLTLPVVSSRSLMEWRARQMLKDADTGRETVLLTVPPDGIALEPGDVVSLAAEGVTRTFAIRTIEEQGARRIEATSVDLKAAGPRAATGTVPKAASITLYGKPRVHVLDLPMLSDSDTDHSPRIAAASVPFPGLLSVNRQSGGSYSRLQVLSAPATLGTLTSDLGPGPLNLFDNANSFSIALLAGGLSSATEQAVLNGANALAVEAQDGSWEILQFRTATLTGTGTYLVSGLLRGQRGTEDAMLAGHVAGATAVLLDAAVPQLALDSALVGLTSTLRVGPAQVDIGDAAMKELTVTPAARGRQPLRPAHLFANRDSVTGDIAISWIRRGRIGADSWGQAEIPPGEDREAYELLIRSGSTLKRTLSASTPAVTYSAALQIADFGAVQLSLDLAVRQLSATYGPGPELRRTILV